MDRREDGDYFKKPTQYFFVNFEPKQNFLFEPVSYNHFGISDSIKCLHKEDYEFTGAKNRQVARSLIHPEYANRFIRKYIL